jgi:hypothetical protein
MRIRIATVSLLLLLVLPLLSFAQPPAKNEKSMILESCEKYFGPPLDSTLNLYEANTFYVVQVTFDKKNAVETIEGVPKYYFTEQHAEWEESTTFECLSWTQYQNLLTKVDLVKSRGKLVQPPPSISIVTNTTAWQTSVYEHARFTVGIVSDLRRPDDPPAEVKWFKLEFGKRKPEKDIKLDTSIFPSRISFY